MDILPIADSNDETARLADLIEGVAGEFSPFEELHGYHIDGVDMETAVLPGAWRDRLVKVQNANTAGAPLASRDSLAGASTRKTSASPSSAPLREKDQNFVAALLEARLVDADVIRSRLQLLPAEHQAAGWQATDHRRIPGRIATSASSTDQGTWANIGHSVPTNGGRRALDPRTS